MQVVGVLLTLLSITLIVAPVGAVVVIYQDNLQELVIPPEISSLITGDGSGSSFLADGADSVDLASLISPEFVSSDIDNNANTFTVIVDITNNMNYTFTLNTLSADVYSTQDNYHLVSIQLSNPPVALTPGGTSRVVVVGSWTDAAETYFIENYSGAQSISVQLENLAIDVNGVTITMNEPFTINVPLTLEG